MSRPCTVCLKHCLSKPVCCSIQRIPLMLGHHYKPAYLCHLYKRPLSRKQELRFHRHSQRARNATADSPAGGPPHGRNRLQAPVAAVGHRNLYNFGHASKKTSLHTGGVQYPLLYCRFGLQRSKRALEFIYGQQYFTAFFENPLHLTTFGA